MLDYDVIQNNFLRLRDLNDAKWCNGFYIEFKQNFTKETFSYDEHLKS